MVFRTNPRKQTHTEDGSVLKQYSYTMTGEEIAERLSTPRELCKTCYDWCSQEDVGERDIPHCLQTALDCRAYLLGTANTCPKHIVL